MEKEYDEKDSPSRPLPQVREVMERHK